MVLPPKKSGELISNLAKHANVSKEGIEKAGDMVIVKFLQVLKKVINALENKTICIESYKSHRLHPKDPLSSSTVDWIFLIDTLNFSFWAETRDKRFEVTYHDKTYSGYWSLCAAINRAIEEGYDITSPKYYATVTLDTLKHIFRSDSGIEIPLIKERQRILNETGKCLIENFQGSFVKCIELCENSVEKLLKLVVDNFPSYKDEATIENYKVSFYKRAQILIGDIWCCFEGKGYGLFHDIETLSVFADYRIPQLLAYLGVLKYSDELQTVLEKGELIENGHRYEVEIRGCTIWAIELICEFVKKKQSEGIIDKNLEINAVLIDNFLWDYRREYAKETDHIPFHKTRCIYY